MTARIGLTPERAKRLSAEIMTSALEAQEIERAYAGGAGVVMDALRDFLGGKK